MILLSSMRYPYFALATCFALLGCGDDEVQVDPPCAASLEVGDANGHADPFGAKAAGQARAGRIMAAADIVAPAHGRQPIETGDFVLANSKIAVVIEDGGLSDGYARFGGEILAVDKIGEDGKPMGLSYYNETLVGLGVEMPDPSSVTVLRDGSDGGEAVVRVIGRLKVIPFIDGPLSQLFKSDYDLEVAYDYVLVPDSERLLIRMSVVNDTEQRIDFGAEKSSSDELYGFFHYSRNQLVTPAAGFAEASDSDWLGFVSDRWSFAWRNLDGPLEFGIEQSGFALYFGPGFVADACGITTSDRVELIAGGPYYDGLREAVRRVDGAASWRAIEGTVSDSEGNAMAGVWVHAMDSEGAYLSRVKTDDSGAFTIHTPSGESARLVAQQQGYLHPGVDVAATESNAALQFEPAARIHVSASELNGASKLPVRIQIIPSVKLPATPAAFGVLDETNGRLYQQFEMHGDFTAVVPPGEHRILVSRGYEYEIYDETIVVAAGETANIDAVLQHSVDTTGVMCADFHIHSFMSADSSDPIDYKVRGAIADGLDIPCSSEHDWVVDFGPVVKKLGVEKWAFGMSSSELTTFTWGHFGVIPLLPRPGSYNNGAIDWVYHSPTEVFNMVDELPEKPAFIVNHPRSSIGGFFSSVGLDPETGVPADSELWSDNFDAIEVFNNSSFEDNRDTTVRDWFGLLNKGMRVFAVGNSDSHHLRTSPVGYPRTCFYFGHDDPQQLSAEKVRDAVLSGNSTVSGGLFMGVLGPDGERPGATLAAGNHTFTVSVESPGWLNTSGDLEVIVSGETVATETLSAMGAGPSHRYVNQVQVALKAGDWVIFHANGADLAPLHPGKTAFAVSNPFFVQ